MIELLVVIAIISLLVSILLPSLNLARSLARSASCKANLHHLHLAFEMYANQNDGKFSRYTLSEPDPADKGDGFWMTSLKPYYDNDGLRFCPEAKTVADTGLGAGEYGDDYFAWGPSSPGMPSWMNDMAGSYCFNAWFFNNPTEVPGWESYAGNFYTQLSQIRQPGATPIFTDGKWSDAWPWDSDVYQADRLAGYAGNYMNRALVRRHEEKLNILHANGSVLTIEPGDLWQLKWHRQFQFQDVVVP